MSAVAIKDRPVSVDGFLPSPNLGAADESGFLSAASDYAVHGPVSDVIGKFSDDAQSEAVKLAIEVMGLTTKRLASGKNTARNFAALITALAKSENVEDSVAHALQVRSNLVAMSSGNEWARYTPPSALGFGSTSAADIARTILNVRETRSTVARRFREAGRSGA